ncbi:hypothetical protein ETAA8_48040 [Anatilimnocola aggregata]|uniref:DUF883 domain-containing protein n=1 Tax=Anatilimnocola aggregata TaxID=2528021 RepID=A0A517YHK0_9BACT|nr:hypothetical protein [Anatilimnocola aggregata]QDU29689.1 hypothetical protein ETAA8_48040 [Anatilimnocola aggregata]
MSNVANPRTKNEENSAGNLATAATDIANEAGTYVADMSKNVASSVKHGAEQAASYVGHRAVDAKSAIGSSLKSAGESLRSAAPQEEDMMHSAACSVAETLENTGKYIEEQGFSGMAEDMTTMIKRNPIPAVLIAAGVGFLLAKACTTSRS